MTLKEIYQALLDGETLINITFGRKIRLAEKGLVDENGEAVFEIFVVPEFWKIYKDPKDDPNKWLGKLCWFWDRYFEQRALGVLKVIDIESERPYQMQNYAAWEHCYPVRRDEVQFADDAESKE